MSKSMGYTAGQIVLHWVIAALVFFQLAYGESMGEFIDGQREGQSVDSADQTLASAHYWVGLAILVLVAIRILMRLMIGAPAPVGSRNLQTMAHIAHAAFYVLLFSLPVTGLLAYYNGDPFGDVHAWTKPVLIALIVVHAGAALLHELLFKDGTLRRMLRPAR